jgi:hypothetical protein
MEKFGEPGAAASATDVVRIRFPWQHIAVCDAPAQNSLIF